MTTQTPDAVREALRAQHDWHYEKAKALSKQPQTADVQWRRNEHREQIDAILAALDSRAGDAGEGLQSAVADVLNAAWSLCDDTENGDSDQPSVPREAWKRLAMALDALESVIPKSEQPCWPGVAARLLAARDPAISGLQPVYGHAAGCGAHDDYDCDCTATPAPAVDDDDIDSPAARLGMVRVALTGIINNPASAVPLAKAGLDFCDLTQAQRQEMRGDA